MDQESLNNFNRATRIEWAANEEPQREKVFCFIIHYRNSPVQVDIV